MGKAWEHLSCTDTQHLYRLAVIQVNIINKRTLTTSAHLLVAA